MTDREKWQAWRNNVMLDIASLETHGMQLVEVRAAELKANLAYQEGLEKALRRVITELDDNSAQGVYLAWEAAKTALGEKTDG